MRKVNGFIWLMLVLLFYHCTDDWNNHYEKTGNSVNVTLWDTIHSNDQYSKFVSYMIEYKMDTFIKSSKTKTLFIPDNQSMSDYLSGDTTGFKETMRYHIAPTFFMIRNVKSQYRMRTWNKKFALIENKDYSYYMDGKEINYSSQLFSDGKYYEVEAVIEPKPNIYQYIKRTNPSVGRYIDTKDTVILDKEKSTPLGFDLQGRTIYDSVTTVENLFEMEYFPISEEFSSLSASLVLPSQSLYNNALDEMAEKLGDDYLSHQDIPEDWQNNVLAPALLHKGIYGGLWEAADFNKYKITNIKGDSIIKDFVINPDSRTILSNGLAYDYAEFSVGDSLFRENRIEGETFCDPIGLNRFTWNEEVVTIDGDKKFTPTKAFVDQASNDSIMNVEFERNYQERYALTFKLKHVFPDNYRLVWNTGFRSTGRFSIYVNDEKIKLGLSQTDSYDTYKLSGGFFSVLGHKLYPNSAGYCQVDGWVNNITEYGDVTVKIEYIGPGTKADNGLTIDYVALLPVKN